MRKATSRRRPAHLGEAAKTPDARPWVVYALGLSQFALRRFPDAAMAWERVRREVPEFEPIYFSLADAYGLQHEEGTALKVLREAERRWPADAEVANAIGVIQIRRGALDAADRVRFERATTIAPQDALGYFNLARARTRCACSSRSATTGRCRNGSAATKTAAAPSRTSRNTCSSAAPT